MIFCIPLYSKDLATISTLHAANVRPGSTHHIVIVSAITITSTSEITTAVTTT